MADIETPFGGSTGTTAIPKWASGNNYVVDQQCLADGDMWSCKANHLSAASNEPPTGVDYATYWEIAVQGSRTTSTQEAAQNAMFPSNFYAASGLFAAKAVSSAPDRYRLLSPADGAIMIGGVKYYWGQQQTLDLSLEETWDTLAGTDYRTAGNRAGKDFYPYFIPPTDTTTTPRIIVSANASAPAGYTTANSRHIHPFHCLCASINHDTTLNPWAADTVIAVGETRRPTVSAGGKVIRCTARLTDFKTSPTTEPNVAGAAVGDILTDDQITWVVELHSLEGYLTGDIIHRSVKSPNFVPHANPIGMTYNAATDTWVDIYMPSGIDTATTSVYNVAISASRTYRQFIKDLAAVGKRPLHSHEYFSARIGGNVQSKINQGSMPGGSGGHIDTYNRRLVANNGCEDLSGVAAQWLADLYSGANGWVTIGTYTAAETSEHQLYQDTWATTTAWYTTRGCCGHRATL
jgi:hypothetical protein